MLWHKPIKGKTFVAHTCSVQNKESAGHPGLGPWIRPTACARPGRPERLIHPTICANARPIDTRIRLSLLRFISHLALFVAPQAKSTQNTILRQMCQAFMAFQHDVNSHASPWQRAH